MTQENTSINIQDAKTSMINNAEARAEIIETGDSSNVKMNSFRLEDERRIFAIDIGNMPDEELLKAVDILKTNIQERSSEIQTDTAEIDEYIDSLSDDEKRSLYNTWKLTHQHESKDKEEYVELKEAMEEPIHKLVIKRLRKANVPFYSNSNISEYITDAERESLIDEATEAYAKFMECLAIDIEHDPNAHDSPRRVAKQFINELMRGRYYPAPAATSFPNKHTGKETGFSGLLVVRAELISVCSHHHATVKGVAYIGIIPKENVIGLSKYIRLAQWCARRGTLQEELAEDIATTIQQYTGSDDVGILIEATHNCVSCRGVMQDDSTTNTTVLKGQFMSDGVLRKEFHDNIMFQKLNKN